MLKQFFRRLFVSGKSNPEPGALLLARQQERVAMGEQIDRTCAEMERVVQDGVGLEGSAAQINHERYRALSASLSADRRRFAMLTSSIAQLQTLRDMEDEFRHVEALDRDTRVCGDLEQLERRQDIIELRAEALSRRSEQLAGLQARRDQTAFAGCAPDDEYDRLVAAARAVAPRGFAVPDTAEPADMTI